MTPIARRAAAGLAGLTAGILASLLAPAAHAQDASPEGSSPAQSPQTLQRVEITGARSDTDQRRQSVAGKIVVGREEIERLGDQTLGEVLRRLPGVTQAGAPGRGGEIRMRGLGGGYTQILIDGQRVPPGFSIEQLSPDQIERIEILRAPTAELGARAIAGTINIVMREGFTRRQERLTTGFSSQRGRIQPGLTWNLSDKLPAALGGGPGDSFNLNLVALRLNRLDSTETRIRSIDTAGTTLSDRMQYDDTSFTREFANLGARVNLRLAGGHTLNLQSFAQLAHGENDSATRQTGSTAWSDARSDGGNRSSTLRLNSTFTGRVSEAARLEIKAGAGRFAYDNGSARTLVGGSAAAASPITEKLALTDSSWSLGTKYTHDAGDDRKFVAGIELEQTTRDENALSTVAGSAIGSAGDTFSASVQRLAGYGQYEWKPTPQWATYTGLRWEGITTRSDYAGGSARNGSSVWTPLLHALWKPFEDSRDQVRMSLTRSYRAPSLNSLIPRQSYCKSFPPGSPGQEADCPDYVGNPNLKPERATGIELAYEHYLSERGLLSVNYFYRRINDLMRTLTTTEPVPVTWTPEARYVSTTQNIGNATTQGVEMELKGGLNELIKQAPNTQLRLNASVFRSSVEGVPGPNNRLSEQPRGTLNIGADHRFAPVPYQVGGTLAFTPSYVTQLSTTQTSYAGMKRTLELFAVVPVSRSAQVRLIGSNLFPQRYASGGTAFFTSSATTPSTSGTTYRDSISSTYTQWQVRLEMRL